MDAIVEFLKGHGFTPQIKSADGLFIFFTNMQCEAGIAFIMQEGKLRFKVEGFLPQSMVRLSTDYMDWADREAFLWKCVGEVHRAILFYKEKIGG